MTMTMTTIHTKTITTMTLKKLMTILMILHHNKLLMLKKMDTPITFGSMSYEALELQQNAEDTWNNNTGWNTYVDSNVNKDDDWDYAGVVISTNSNPSINFPKLLLPLSYYYHMYIILTLFTKSIRHTET